MLLERLIESAGKKFELEGDSYYTWLFSQDAGRKVTDFLFWECKSSLTVNLLYLPARYGKCRCCSLIQLPS